MKKLWLFLLPIAALMIFVAIKCKDDEGHTVPLPASIQNYLNANYPGAEIEESEMDTLCTGTAVYEVEVEVSDDNEIGLTFDTEGNMLFSENEIKVSDLPAAVSAGISANFAGYSTAEAEKLSMADGSFQYEAELKKNGQPTLEVLFATDGTVICQEEEDENDDDE
jgi:uncharacterized membrane protein YkoI